AYSCDGGEAVFSRWHFENDNTAGVVKPTVFCDAFKKIVPAYGAQIGILVIDYRNNIQILLVCYFQCFERVARGEYCWSVMKEISFTERGFRRVPVKQLIFLYESQVFLILYQGKLREIILIHQE